MKFIDAVKQLLNLCLNEEPFLQNTKVEKSFHSSTETCISGELFLNGRIIYVRKTQRKTGISEYKFYINKASVIRDSSSYFLYVNNTYSSDDDKGYYISSNDIGIKFTNNGISRYNHSEDEAIPIVDECDYFNYTLKYDPLDITYTEIIELIDLSKKIYFAAYSDDYE